MHGDVRPLVIALERHAEEPLRLGESIEDAQRLWWELSTLYGRVIGSVRVALGDWRGPAEFAFRPYVMTGGPPRLVANAGEIAIAWTEALHTPATMERHRRAMLETWRDFAAGVHSDPESADCLLRHHTELPIDEIDGRLTLYPDRTIAEAVRDMHQVPTLLGDAIALRASVTSGLTSPSLPRRDLAWRLMRLPS